MSDPCPTNGYDMVTGLGSNLIFTRQTASLEDRGQIEIVRQNFGFDIENGVNEVELDRYHPAACGTGGGRDVRYGLLSSDFV